MGDIIPPTLQQSLAARLDRLGEARDVAQIGAVVGREFSFGLLLEIAGPPSATLSAGLEKLVDADLVFIDGVAPDLRYRFKHALIQEAAYESMLRSRRREIHRQIAEALIRLQPAIAETSPETLATHLERAGDDAGRGHLLAEGRIARAKKFGLPGGDRRLPKRTFIT